MTQLTVEALEAAGYRWYPDGIYGGREDNLGLWQKTFSDAGGERFSLFFRVWRRDVPADSDLHCRSFTPTVQFRVPGDLDTTVNIQMIHGRESLEDVEAFYQRAFDAMAFAYALKNG